VSLLFILFIIPEIHQSGYRTESVKEVDMIPWMKLQRNPNRDRS